MIVTHGVRPPLPSPKVISLQCLNLSLTPIELSHYQVEAAGQVSDAGMAWSEQCRCVEGSTELDELKGSPADLLTGTPLDLHGLGAEP